VSVSDHRTFECDNLQVQRIALCYCERQQSDAYGSLDKGHPIFMKLDPHVYVLPASEYPKHIKVYLLDDDSNFGDIFEYTYRLNDKLIQYEIH